MIVSVQYQSQIKTTFGVGMQDLADGMVNCNCRASFCPEFQCLVRNYAALVQQNIKTDNFFSAKFTYVLPIL